jgi:hypothetical protein
MMATKQNYIHKEINSKLNSWQIVIGLGRMGGLEVAGGLAFSLPM